MSCNCKELFGTLYFTFHTYSRLHTHAHIINRNIFMYFYLFTHAGCIATSVGIALSRIYLFVCLSVCLHSKTKTAWAINTKLCTHILYSSCSSCIDPEVKRSKVKVTWLWKPSVARLLVMRAATAMCCFCWHGSACRYDYLCYLVMHIFCIIRISGNHFVMFTLSIFLCSLASSAPVAQLIVSKQWTG